MPFWEVCCKQISSEHPCNKSIRVYLKKKDINKEDRVLEWELETL